MTFPFRRLWNRLASASRPTRPSRLRTSRLELETLEDRAVPSVSSSDFRVPTTVTNNQFQAVNASSQNGLSVAVWTHRFSSSDTDIKAQMYNANGTKRGGEITIASSSRIEQAPSVAMDNFGDWKVVWEQYTTSTNRDVLAARYLASGAKSGSTITVANSSKNEYDASVAVNAVGDFVVSYTLDFSSTDQDVHAKMYSDGGAFQRSITVANAGSGVDEYASAVARSTGSSGVFAIAYQRGSDIYVKRYSATGATLVNTHAIATGTPIQRNPAVSMDNFGRTVVVWEQQFSGLDFDIKARTIGNTGFVGGIVNIASTSNAESNPSVAMDRSDGDYVVAYRTGSQVFVREMNFSGTPKSSAFFLGTRSSLANPAVSIDGFDRYFVTYTDSNRIGDQGFGVYGRFGRLV